MHSSCDTFSRLLKAVRQTAWLPTPAGRSATSPTVPRQKCEGMWIGRLWEKGASASVALLTAGIRLGAHAGG